jgi:hypothetical protein
MKTEKPANINIRCSQAHKAQIVALAKSRDLSLSDLIITELLNLEIATEDVISTYPVGKEGKYSRRYLTTKKVYIDKNNKE